MLKNLQEGVSAALTAVSFDRRSKERTRTAAGLVDFQTAQINDGKNSPSCQEHVEALQKVPGWKYVCESNSFLSPVKSQSKILIERHHVLKKYMLNANRKLSTQLEDVHKFECEWANLGATQQLMTEVGQNLEETLRRVKHVEERIELAIQEKYEAMKEETQNLNENEVLKLEKRLRSDCHRLSFRPVHPDMPAVEAGFYEDEKLEGIHLENSIDDQAALEDFLNT
mmetsp:Transcript_14071/g.18423  ORF Transcript_14071/g.18423 Transcript_14071/m.18423 type:complete len:226 (-) Transcript_14071:1835-2512(-)